MTIRVKLPNGQYGQFPDGTPHTEIESVLQKQFPPTEEEGFTGGPHIKFPEEDKGWTSLFADAVEGLGNLMEGGRKFVGELPEESVGAKNQLLDKPARFFGQLGNSLLSAGKGTLNLPHDINTYLASKELTPFENVNQLYKDYASVLPSITEDTGLESKLGLETKEPGDKLLKASVPLATALYGGAKGLVGLKNLATAPSKHRQAIRTMEANIDNAAKNANLSNEQLEALKNSLKLQYSEEHPGSIGELNPTGQQVAINEKSRKIGELAPNAAKAKPGEIPPEPDVKAAEKQLSAALESTRNHEKHGGRIYQKAILEDKDAASKLYDDYRKGLSEHDLKVDNSKEIKDVTAKLNEMKDNDELAPGYGSGTEEQKALEKQLKALESETVNAEDVFAVKRTLDHMAERVRDKQYSGVDDLEFKRLRDIADRLESKSSKLGDVLESVGSQDLRSMLKKANKGWSNYSAAKDHPVGRKALKEGFLAPNTIGKLESTHRGSEYLRSIKDKDLQLQKHIFSQKYGKESQFKHLLEPKEEAEPYLANLEHLHEPIENLRDVKHAKEQHQALVSSMKDAAKIKSLEKQIKFHKDALPEIQAKMKKVEEDSAEHKRLQKELETHKKDIQDKGGRLKELLKFYAKVKLAGKVHL